VSGVRIWKGPVCGTVKSIKSKSPFLRWGLLLLLQSLNERLPWLGHEKTLPLTCSVTPSKAGYTYFPVSSHISPHLLLPAPTSRTTSWHHTFHPKDGDSKVLQNNGFYCNTTWHHNPQDHDLNQHYHDNKSCTWRGLPWQANQTGKHAIHCCCFVYTHSMHIPNRV
jgi:hypothetical protein